MGLPADSLLVQDSLPVTDTAFSYIESDTVSRKPGFVDSSWRLIDSLPIIPQVLKRHPFFQFRAAAVSYTSNIRERKGQETLFYVLTALVLLFALFKMIFAKYFNDLFRVFFRTTLKQRQIREQLMQTPLPSLAFNFFFVASAGLYIDYLMQYFDFRPVGNFWLLYLYCCAGLAIIYLVKFIGLKICGWMFNMKGATDSYIFIVFIINKVIGIFLLPFLVLLGFTQDPIYSIALVISWAGIAGLLLYRFILGFTAVRNEVRFNLFHFFLYLLAAEVAPLILIYRLLLLVF